MSLPGTDGTKTVYLHLRDVAGNVILSPKSDSIILDTTAPTLSSFQAAVYYTSSLTVNLSLGTASDSGGSGSIEYAASLDAATPSAGWSSTKPSSIDIEDTADGEQSIYLHIRDSLGNTRYYEDTVYLDRSAPSLPDFDMNDGKQYTNLSTVSLGASAASDTGSGSVSGIEYAKSWTADKPSSGWSATLPTEANISSQTGYILVYLHVRDPLGNWAYKVDHITRDVVDPDPTEYVYTVSATTPAEIEITFTVDDTTGVQSIVLGGDVVGGTFTSNSVTMTVTLVNAAGDNTISVVVTDLAGNVSTEETIVIDPSLGNGAGEMN